MRTYHEFIIDELAQEASHYHGGRRMSTMELAEFIQHKLNMYKNFTVEDILEIQDLLEVDASVEFKVKDIMDEAIVRFGYLN